MFDVKIVFLDAGTVGDDAVIACEDFKNTVKYNSTSPDEVAERIADCDVVVINKVKLNRDNLKYARRLRQISVLATGYDNIDLDYCRENGIAVTNVAGYSTVSVAQVSVSMVLSLVNRLNEYSDFVKDGSYSASASANRLSPIYHEISSLKWGVVGAGNIGMKVADTAAALGAEVMLSRSRTDIPSRYPVTDIDTLCRESDIISLHTPLNPSTRNLISRERISQMKDGVILVNTARGAVTDEAAIAESVCSGKIGGFGCDVYSAEPFPTDHPFSSIMGKRNVILTPHMAWGSYESRMRCLDETFENIRAFLRGELRSRIV